MLLIFTLIFLLTTVVNALVLDPIRSGDEEKCNQDEPEFFFNSQGRNISCASHRNYFAQMIIDIERNKREEDIKKTTQKFCREWPEVRECFTLAAQFWEPCSNLEERQVVKTVLNMMDTLANYSCHKEGEPIILFITEGGLDCYVNKRTVILECMAPFVTENDDSWKANSSLGTMQYLRFTEDKCRNYKRLQNCTVSVLKTCSNPAPANILNRMFNQVWRSTSCEQYETRISAEPSRPAVAEQGFSSDSNKSFNKKVENCTKQDESLVVVNADGVATFCDSEKIFFTSLISDIKKYRENRFSVRLMNINAQKLCRRWPKVRECMVLEGKALEPCLDLEDKEDVKTKLNFMVALTNISCHNGDHMIISFIAEGGMDCLVSRTEALRECVATSTVQDPWKVNFSLDVFQYPTFTEESCRNYIHMQNCTVSVFKTCTNPAPANILNRLFTERWASTSCEQYESNVSAESTTDDDLTSSIRFTINTTQVQDQYTEQNHPPVENSRTDKSPTEAINNTDVEKKSQCEMDDEFDAFGRYVATQLRKFNNTLVQATTKHRISELLFNAEIEILSAQNHQNCTK